MRLRCAWLLGLTLFASIAIAAPVKAAEPTSAVLLSGGATTTRGSTRPVAPGTRIASAIGTWNELAFSDGSSIVIEQGAEFVLGAVPPPHGSDTLVQGTLDLGRIRVSAGDRTAVTIHAGDAEVTVKAAVAIITAGAGGSVVMVSGNAVTVRVHGVQQVLRRAGWAVGFDQGEARRVPLEQLTTTAMGSEGPTTSAMPPSGSAQAGASASDTATGTTAQPDAGGQRNNGAASSASSSGSGSGVTNTRGGSGSGHSYAGINSSLSSDPSSFTVSAPAPNRPPTSLRPNPDQFGSALKDAAQNATNPIAAQPGLAIGRPGISTTFTGTPTTNLGLSNSRLQTSVSPGISSTVAGGSSITNASPPASSLANPTIAGQLSVNPGLSRGATGALGTRTPGPGISNVGAAGARPQ